MTIKLITPPALEPVTLAEAKLHLRVDAADEDALISTLIGAAREAAEHITERAFITQTWELALDAFPGGAIRLDRPALISVVSIKYDDEAGVEQTVPPGTYSTDTYQEPGWVWLNGGAAWPATLSAPNAVRIRFTAGYGAAGSDVPDGIKSWIKVRVGALYRNREELVDGRLAAPTMIDHLLDKYRVWVF